MDSLGARIPSWAVPECDGQLVAKSEYKYSAEAACPRVACALAEGGSRATRSSVLRPRVIFTARQMGLYICRSHGEWTPELAAQTAATPLCDRTRKRKYTVTEQTVESRVWKVENGKSRVESRE